MAELTSGGGRDSGEWREEEAHGVVTASAGDLMHGGKEARLQAERRKQLRVFGSKRQGCEDY